MRSTPTHMAGVALVVVLMSALTSPARSVDYPTCPKYPAWTGDLGCAKDSYGNYKPLCDMTNGPWIVNFLGKTAEGNPVSKTNFFYQVYMDPSVYKSCGGSSMNSIQSVNIRLSSCCCVNLPALVDAGLAYASYCKYTSPSEMGHCINSNSGSIWKSDGTCSYSSRTEYSGKDYDDGEEHTSWLRVNAGSSSQSAGYLIKLTFNMKVDQDLGPNSLACVNAAGGQCGCKRVAGPDTCSIAKLLPKYYVKTPGDSCFKSVSPTTSKPTKSPTKNPTVSPTDSPTKNPSVSPTKNPTVSPTKDPTVSPTKNPTVSPTKNPTVSPTKNPTISPTKSPSASPTISPTLSPTPCSGPPPDYERGSGRQCGPEGSANAIVEITNPNNEPVVTTNAGEGTTTFCYDYRLVNPSAGQGCSGVASSALVGMSFVLDECCPDKKMRFVAGVSVNGGASSASFGKDECRLDGVGIRALSNGCVKARRACNQASLTLRNQRCTVVNANGLGLSAMNGQYCMTVSGVNYEEPGTNAIKPNLKQKSKICAERGSNAAGSSQNYQACVEVTFVDSSELCQDTASPTKNPTKNPTISPTKNPTVSPTKNPTRSPTKDPTRKPSSSPTISPTQAPVCFGAAQDITKSDPASGCTASCSFANSVWGVSLVSRTVVTVNGAVVTKFKYKISAAVGYASGTCPTTPIAAIAIRFDECCGQGFLQTAYNNGDVRFDGGGYPAQAKVVTGAAGESDYVLVTQTIFQTMSAYLTIIVKGNVPATAAGRACVKGSYPTTCACKAMATPNSCFIAGAVARTARPTYYRRRALAERLSG